MQVRTLNNTEIKHSAGHRAGAQQSSVASTRTEQRLEGTQTMGEGQLTQVKHLKGSPEKTSLVLRLG